VSGAKTPVAVAPLDLERGLDALDFGATPDGVPYAEALLLVRRQGDPLAAALVPLDRGAIGAERLRALVERAVEPALERQRPPEERLVDRGPPFASVIVPTAGRPERIEACVRGLQGLRYASFEIVVVDNAPDVPGTREAVKRMAAEDRRVRYVAERAPGSSVARNRGIREAAADLLAFTDDDVLVDPDWLAEMIEPFLRDERVGVVTGLVMPARMDTPEQRWFEEYSGFGKGLEPRVYDLEQGGEGHLLYPYWGAAFGSGNSMAFRRSVIEGIGGFDPALGAGSPARAGADIEAFSHAILAGGRLAYQPRAVCWHDHRASGDALRRQTFSYGAGFTAIVTKWVLRRPRLAVELFAQVGRALVRRRRDRGDEAAPRELGRLRNQLAMSRAQGTLGVQLGGYAVGPALYLRSALWARRRRLNAVLERREVAA
jgi:O-antigen biosynthesis protein